jgi:hypothetical protein
VIGTNLKDVLIVKRSVFRSLIAKFINYQAHEMVKVNIVVLFILKKLKFFRTKITPYQNSEYKITIRGN